MKNLYTRKEINFVRKVYFNFLANPSIGELRLKKTIFQNKKGFKKI